jgi:predicted ATPase
VKPVKPRRSQKSAVISLRWLSSCFSLVALYDPAEHRPLATRFGTDAGVTALSFRSWVLWFLGFPDAALIDAGHALKNARAIGQAATLMIALNCTSFTHMLCRSYAEASSLLDQLVALADEKGAAYWIAGGNVRQGDLFALTGKAAVAVQTITAGLAAMRSTGATVFVPTFLSSLARAYADLGRFDDAWRSIDEAMATMETTKERWGQAEINRVAGEIALKSPEPNAAKAHTYFQRALAVARQQQAKSWELRTAMSLARLWRDQGKVRQARELLAPVYGWFTEG